VAAKISNKRTWCAVRCRNGLSTTWLYDFCQILLPDVHPSTACTRRRTGIFMWLEGIRQTIKHWSWWADSTYTANSGTSCQIWM